MDKFRCSAIAVLVVLLLAGGCATSHRMNSVSLGMTKQQVVEALGVPVSTSATQGVEYLNYRFSETPDHAYYGVTTPYFVRIVDGKVEAYGRRGDFETPRSTIDLNVKQR
jgi:outer membrane protein assembly factor BamE (lipoprotein component of BamABCDE complex)